VYQKCEESIQSFNRSVNNASNKKTDATTDQHIAQTRAIPGEATRGKLWNYPHPSTLIIDTARVPQPHVITFSPFTTVPSPMMGPVSGILRDSRVLSLRRGLPSFIAGTFRAVQISRVEGLGALGFLHRVSVFGVHSKGTRVEG
jgi:hypothetical protein